MLLTVTSVPSGLAVDDHILRVGALGHPAVPGTPRSALDLFGFIDGAPEHMAGKATALCFPLVMNHPFVDGNKRIGHAAMETFLVMNGYELAASVGDAEKVILTLAAGDLSREELLEWVTVGVREHQGPKKITNEPRVKAQTNLTRMADPRKSLTKTYIYAYLAVPTLLFIIFVYLFFSNLNPNLNRRWLHRRSSGYHMLLVSMLGGFASGMSFIIIFLLNSSGHRVYFDNTTSNTAFVYIDGLRRVSLEPKTRIRFTLSGGIWDFRVESGDADSEIIVRSKLRLHFFRPSNVIYNIENANSFWMDKAKYRY